MTRPCRGCRGFTLVEVLIALVVMGVMAAMAWQGVDGIVKTRDISQQRLERTLRIDSVIAQWETDLASLQENAAVPAALVCDGATVRMTRRTDAGLQVVAWSLRPDAADSTWRRWAAPPATTNGALQESWLRSEQLQGGEPGQLRVLTGLAQWQVYFYRGNSWSNCQSSATGLPSGVRLVLGFAPGSGYAGDLVRDTLVTP